jgi:hypothetical protein
MHCLRLVTKGNRLQALLQPAVSNATLSVSYGAISMLPPMLQIEQ